MDGLRFINLFNSISVISGQSEGDYKGVSAMKGRLDSERTSVPAGLKPAKSGALKTQPPR